MDSFKLTEHTHRRLNILTGEYILVSPHRSKRPWQGKTENQDRNNRPKYDPDCYLCPGNTRANGSKNPDYTDVFVFPNDFGAITPNIPLKKKSIGFFQYESERGICKVICFSPRHDLTIPELDCAAIEKIVHLWQDQCREISQNEYVRSIQIFENKGDVMGCSNPHPHGQIWSQESIPVELEKKSRSQKKYFEEESSNLLSSYLEEELKIGDRILYQNKHMVVLVPFWATWPYESMILPRRSMAHITQMTKEEVSDFAKAYRQLTILYDNLFEASFPYSAGIHQAPFNSGSHPEWHWHMCFYPPLLRSATVKKFMVGYEMLAEPQRDITAEQAAAKLRSLSSIHYKKR